MSDSLEPFAYKIAAYLRIASIAISLYDYLETLPTVWRFYKEQYETRRVSLSFVLFLLIRATSICVLVISNVGFFYSGFTLSTCAKFCLFPPVFKVLQVMVSQAILGVRAWNLSRRSRKITYLLFALYCVACILQWFSTLYQRTPKLGGPEDSIKLLEHGNCRAFNDPHYLGAYAYYAVAVAYDFATTAICVFYLLKYKMASNNSLMSKVTRMMLYDGIGYFVVLAAINVLNLILFRVRNWLDLQTAAASLAYTVSWIMSQRLLMHLYDASRERRNENIEEAITVTQHLDSARQISYAIRSQFEPKSGGGFDLTIPDFELGTDTGQAESPDDLEVQVRIEHTVKLDRRLRTFELENYSRSERYSQDIHSRRR